MRIDQLIDPEVCGRRGNTYRWGEFQHPSAVETSERLRRGGKSLQELRKKRLQSPAFKHAIRRDSVKVLVVKGYIYLWHYMTYERVVEYKARIAAWGVVP